jgi:hypothetical protein
MNSRSLPGGTIHVVDVAITVIIFPLKLGLENDHSPLLEVVFPPLLVLHYNGLLGLEAKFQVDRYA